MNEEAKKRVEILRDKYPEDMRWILVDKGARKGWIFKYYMTFYRPGTHEKVYYKCGHDEYWLWDYGWAAPVDAF